MLCADPFYSSLSSFHIPDFKERYFGIMGNNPVFFVWANIVITLIITCYYYDETSRWVAQFEISSSVWHSSINMCILFVQAVEEKKNTRHVMVFHGAWAWLKISHIVQKWMRCILFLPLNNHEGTLKRCALFSNWCNSRSVAIECWAYLKMDDTKTLTNEAEVSQLPPGVRLWYSRQHLSQNENSKFS